MLHVALISSSYSPYPGGVEEHTRNLARELHDRGLAVEVWTVDRGEHLGTRTIDGITVRYLPTPLPSVSLSGLVSFARLVVPAWRAWRGALRTFRPDMLHVQCFGPNGVYAWTLHRLTQIPLIVSAHGETFMDEHDVFATSRLLTHTLRRAVRDADEVTGCSQMVLDDLHRRFGLVKDGVVVPNGVDLAEIDRLGIGPIVPDPASSPTVFAVGRVVKVKGFDLLIQAFAAADLPAHTRLVIGGDGPELPGLVALADELSLRNRVTFPGRLSRAEVIEGMATADLVVVPSRIEAFGIVVLEAWRSGTALLGTSRGGPGELISNGFDGVVVDPVDTSATARVLSALMHDATLRRALARHGLATVSGYTWARTADAYRDIYNRLAPSPSGSGPATTED